MDNVFECEETRTSTNRPLATRSLVFLLFVTLSAALAEQRAYAAGGLYDATCGSEVDVSNYVVEAKDVKISLPLNVQIIVNGAKLYESKPPILWNNKNNGAGVYFSKDNILLITYFTDCVDIYASRIFVFDRDGALKTTDAVWASNWANGFFLKTVTWFIGANGFARVKQTPTRNDQAT